MKNQTFEQAVEKVVNFWAEKSFDTLLNQNNGDESPNGGMAFMLMNLLSSNAQSEITDSQKDVFKSELTKILKKNKNERGFYIGCDYHPHEYLAKAAKKANISESVFPCKTGTRIDPNNVASASYQYRGEWKEL